MQGQYKEGQKIKVAHKCCPQCTRYVTYENGGIRVENHWFSWEFFFKVNFIVTD